MVMMTVEVTITVAGCEGRRYSCAGQQGGSRDCSHGAPANMVSGHPSSIFPGDPKSLPAQAHANTTALLLMVPSLFLAHIHTLVDIHMGSCHKPEKVSLLPYPGLTSRTGAYACKGWVTLWGVVPQQCSGCSLS